MEETGSKQKGWKEKQETEKRGATKGIPGKENEDIKETYFNLHKAVTSKMRIMFISFT